MLSHFSKAGAACLCALICCGAIAEEKRTSTEGGEWLEKSRDLIEESANTTAPEWMNAVPSEEAIAIAEEIARESGMRPGPRDRPNVERPGTVLIFGSFSMPEETLRNLLDQAADKDVMFVLRGMVDTTNIRSTLNRIKAVIGNTVRIPSVVIDPTLYKRFNITQAPTLVLVREKELQPVIAVGAVTVDWLRRQASRIGRRGDANLGIRAEHYDIAEVDLIVEMQRRLANIDWNKKRQASIDRFWRNKSDFIHLPDAKQDHEFEVDPTVRVSEDIKDAEGNVLVHAGEAFNPLDVIPLSKTVIVFRGTDPAQIAMANEVASRVRSEGRGVILLTTTVDTENGWKSMNAMEQDLRGPVYLLQANLAQRFQLRHVPSTVTSRGNRLIVNEMAVRVTHE